MSRDISVAGAYVRTPTCPSQGVTVEVEIFLPPLEPKGKSVKVVRKGQVIRVEPPAAGEAEGGFAMFGKGLAAISVKER